MEELVRTWKEIDRARCTHFLEAEKGGLVRTRKETDRLRHTHQLEAVEGGTCQDIERNQPSKAHSLPGGGRGRDLSGHRKKPTNRGTLTLWKWKKENLVRTWKETDRPRHTHILEATVERTCQDTERNRPGEVHSRPGDSRERDLSGHGRNRPSKAHSLSRRGRGR